MRICVLGINYWPETFGIAPFTTGRCEYLAAAGHEVTVCTSFPYYPEWKVRPEYAGRWYAREHRHRVEILRVRQYVPSRPSTPRRMVHEASYVASAAFVALAQRKPDVVLAVSPPLALGLAAVMLNRIWGVPYVFHVEDLQPDAASDLGMMKSGTLLRLLFRVERAAYDNAALVSTLTDGMRRRVLAKGVPAREVEVFPQWAAPDLFTTGNDGRGEAFRREHGLDDKLLVVHAGNMGVKQGLEVVLGAAELSRDDPRVAYLLAGDGAARAGLQEHARRRSLANVKFLPPQYGDAFGSLLEASDICLITQQRSVSDIVFPSKIPQLMAAAKALIASVSPTSEVGSVITEASAGLVVAPEDPVALWEGIRALRQDNLALRTAGQRARSYARARWDRECSLRLMEKHLLTVASGRGTSMSDGRSDYLSP